MWQAPTCPCACLSHPIHSQCLFLHCENYASHLQPPSIAQFVDFETSAPSYLCCFLGDGVGG